MNADGGIDLTWDAVPGAKSYVIHYGFSDKTRTDDKYMEYSEGTTYTLTADKIPAHDADAKLYFYVQSFGDVGVGNTTEAQAEYLNAGEFTGSDWSRAATVTLAA